GTQDFLGVQHDGMDTAGPMDGPFGGLILEQDATATNFLACKQCLLAFDCIHYVQYADVFRGPGQPVTAPDAIAGFDNSGFGKFGENLGHKNRRYPLNLGQVAAAGSLCRGLSQPEQAMQG